MAPTTVFTASEDAVIGSAVSKYGLQQWARVSSLLSSKSAKQCKLRWENYLDPSLKKTEFTREEDAQLLQLARVFSTSWRTIAQVMGRTANQCLIRYQQLLDEAEKKESEELGLTGVGEASAAPTAEGTRGVGGNDYYPENAEPRPMAVDADEEELEMLSEARARLGNTSGKKAKRKARERLLEESRRAAVLAKNRELRAVGLSGSRPKPRKGQMDYNQDIPFEHLVPEGFYDVGEELEQNERAKAAFDPKKQHLNNKRKSVQTNADETSKRRKPSTNDGPSPSAEANRVALLQRRREAERQGQRRALNLPAPQINEGELEEVVKMGMSGQRAGHMASESDNDATKGLVGDYRMVPDATPIRTPRGAPQEDRLAQQIRDIKALNENTSAILGNDNTEMSEEASGGFQKSAGRQQLVTPNPMATPLRQRSTLGATPARGPGATPMRTPRDTLNLNRQDELARVGQTPREVKLHERSIRDNLLAKLAALPKPKAIDYELETPEEQAEVEKMRWDMGEDASARDARAKLLRDAAELADFKRQSQVLQKRLPRPKAIDADAMLKAARQVEDPVERDVAVEMALLIMNDASKSGDSKITGKAKPLRVFEDEDMRKARELVQLELSSDDAQKEKAEFATAWTELHERRTILPGLDGYYEDEVDEHQMMVETFDNLQDEIQAKAEKCHDLESKLAKVHGGYQNRSKMLQKKIIEAADALEKTRITLNTALSAQVAEDAAIASRLEKLREEVTLVTRREREAQEEYRRAKDELDGLPATNGYH